MRAYALPAVCQKIWNSGEPAVAMLRDRRNDAPGRSHRQTVEQQRTGLNSIVDQAGIGGFMPTVAYENNRFLTDLQQVPSSSGECSERHCCCYCSGRSPQWVFGFFLQKQRQCWLRTVSEYASTITQFILPDFSHSRPDIRRFPSKGNMPICFCVYPLTLVQQHAQGTRQRKRRFFIAINVICGGVSYGPFV